MSSLVPVRPTINLLLTILVAVQVGQTAEDDRAIIDRIEVVMKTIFDQPLSKEEQQWKEQRVLYVCKEYSLDRNQVPSLKIHEQVWHVNIHEIYITMQNNQKRWNEWNGVRWPFLDLFMDWPDPERATRPPLTDPWIPPDCHDDYRQYMVAYEEALLNLLRLGGEDPPPGALILPIHNQDGDSDPGLRFGKPLYRVDDLLVEPVLTRLRTFRLADQVPDPTDPKQVEWVRRGCDFPPRHAALHWIRLALYDHLADHDSDIPSKLTPDEYYKKRMKEIHQLEEQEERKTKETALVEPVMSDEPVGPDHLWPAEIAARALIGKDMERYREAVTILQEMKNTPTGAPQTARRAVYDRCRERLQRLYDTAETVVFKVLLADELAAELRTTAELFGWGLTGKELETEQRLWFGRVLTGLESEVFDQLGLMHDFHPPAGRHILVADLIRLCRREQQIIARYPERVPLLPVARPVYQLDATYNEIRYGSVEAQHMPVHTYKIITKFQLSEPNTHLDQHRAQEQLQDRANEVVGRIDRPEDYRQVLTEARDLPLVYEAARAALINYLLWVREPTTRERPVKSAISGETAEDTE
jgi:hypothetical protein